MRKFGKDMSKMAGLDLFLTSLSKEECEQVEKNLKPAAKVSPLLSMDIYLSSFQRSLELARRKTDLNFIFGLDPLYPFQFDHELILNKDYDALVLTDAGQKIKWVNKGFSKMTGYSAFYAVGKTPKFLQGEDTLPDVQSRIRNKLAGKDIFSEIVVNYRKNKEKYKCEITVIPLFNSTKQTTHFLAIEKEVA